MDEDVFDRVRWCVAGNPARDGCAARCGLRDVPVLYLLQQRRMRWRVRLSEAGNGSKRILLLDESGGVMEIEIPDNEDAACDLGDVEIMLARKGHYDSAGMVSGAIRRLRADAEEIERLEAELAELRADLFHVLDRLDTFGLYSGSTDEEDLALVRAARKGE
jgi:hypothetical protein